MTLTDIVLIIFLISLNAFFVSVEFAVVASRRSRLDLIAEEQSYAARLVRSWLEKPAARDRLIAASQLGITVVSLALGAVGENAFEAALEPLFADVALPAWLNALEQLVPLLPLALSLVVVSSLHVVLGEQVPKVAVLRSPERFALFAAPMMNVFSVVFKWFIDILDFITHLILRLSGIPEGSGHGVVSSVEELREMVSGPEVEGVIEEPEREILSAVIDFGEMVVRQVMVHRTEIVAVEGDAPLEEAIRLAASETISKVPVFEGTLDQITGIVFLQDLLRLEMDPQTRGTRVCREVAREALFVPESTSVHDLLRAFRSGRSHIAIVLDEFGGTAGLVTLDDLLGEIIGEVQDAFDEEEDPEIQQMPDGSALIDGAASIDEVNEFFNLELVDPDYDTIAGFVLGKLGHIPQVGETAEDADNGVALQVEEMDRLRIARVSLRRL